MTRKALSPLDSKTEDKIVFPRLKIPLENDWSFLEDDCDLGESSGWFENLPTNMATKKCIISSPFQAQFPELRDYHGLTWYQKDVFVPEKLNGSSAILHFGAINYDPKIWINNILAPEDFSGGYFPISVEISNYLKFGKSNRLTVRTYYPHPRILPYYPHGKQKWYGQVGGIWQNGYVEFSSNPHIENCIVHTSLGKRPRADFQIKIEGEAKQGCSISIKILELPLPASASGTRAAIARKDRVPVPSGIEKEITLRVPMIDAKFWSPDHPHCYEAIATLHAGEIPIDEVSVEFGLRKFQAIDGELFLNGEPFLIRGALNQGYYPETLYTPPTEDFIRRELELAKKLGLNLLRLHVKIEDERYIKWANRLGILIWEDLPHVEIFNDDAKNRLEKIYRRNLIRDRNHPSVVIWCIANEAWGPDPSNPNHARWLDEMYRLGKPLSPGSLIIDNSPCYPNYHSKTDIADYHFYTSVPGGFKTWEKFLKLLDSPSRARNKLLFGPNKPRGQEPIIISEFGTWGLPRTGALKEKDDREPWWFGQGWGSGIPAGLDWRFSEWGLSEIWDSLEEMEAATQRHQYESLRYLVESIRRRSRICGYVITQFYDLHWEANGLVDFNRSQKVPLGDIQKLNADDLLFVDRSNTKLNLWSGEIFSVPVYFSKWSPEPIRDGLLEWRFGDDHGTEKIISKIGSFNTTCISKIKLKAPNVSKPEKVVMELRLNWKSGSLSTSLDFLIVPKKEKSLPINSSALSNSLFFHSSLPRSSDDIVWKLEKKMGHAPSNSKKGMGASLLGQRSVVISSTYDETVEQHLAKGGRALIIANRRGIFDVGGKRFSIEPRDEEDSQGFNFIREERLFAPLPIENPMGWTYYSVMPKFIIRNVLPKDRDKVCSGYFAGWIHDFGATLLKESFPQGGRVLLTTLNFEDYWKDPVATTILDNLIADLKS